MISHTPETETDSVAIVEYARARRGAHRYTDLVAVCGAAGASLILWHGLTLASPLPNMHWGYSYAVVLALGIAIGISGGGFRTPLVPLLATLCVFVAKCAIEFAFRLPQPSDQFVTSDMLIGMIACFAGGMLVAACAGWCVARVTRFLRRGRLEL